MSLLVAVSGNAMAQNEYDALRYSQTYIQGTARSAAMGGAFGALGGDISCMAINPAGVGVYREGDACVSLELIANNSKVTPTSYSGKESKYSMKLPSAGFVAAHGTGATSGFSGWAFGVGFNRLNDFTLREEYDYKNKTNSMLDAWTDRSQGIYYTKLDPFNTALGWESQLIDIPSVGEYDEFDKFYVNCHNKDWDGVNSGYGQRQKYLVDQKGGINCWDFTFAGSFSEQLYFGASLGIQTLNYKTTNKFKEDDVDDIVAYENYDFTEYNKTYGSGVNVKFGVIYKPIQYVRLGAAIHTPTVMNITEKYYTTLFALFDEGTFDDGHTTSDVRSEDYEGISNNNEYTYRLVTPFKSVLSAAFVYPGFGLLSFDYESVNYANNKLRHGDDDDYDFEVENEGIKEKFQKTQNFRVGAEGLVGPISIRAGYALYGNPCQFVSGKKQRQILSAGVGLRLNEHSYLDITGTYHIYQTGSYIYESANANHSMIINHDNRYFHVMATIGYKF